ncbi:MAG: hypothetical protein LBS43_06685 [Prevotellaceae bacterium]|jgi:hypothetical protein|nr:hypothetical protein [Prevotellaceae bacterium]
MDVKQIEVKGNLFYLAIEPLYDEITTQYLGLICYFSVQVPTCLLAGELFRNNDNKPKLFISIEEAIEYAKEELSQRLYNANAEVQSTIV